MNTKAKIASVITLTAALSAALFAGLSYLEARESLRAAAYADLTEIRDDAAQDVELFFIESANAAQQLASRQNLTQAMMDLQAAFRNINQGGETVLADESSIVREYYNRRVLPRIAKYEGAESTTFEKYGPKTRAARHLQHEFIVKRVQPTNSNGRTYTAAHARHDEMLRGLLQESGFSDLFLIDYDTGDVVYTVEKNIDFGANIYSGAFGKAGLGVAADRVKIDPVLHLSDIGLYAANGHKPAVFYSAPINLNGVPIGIVAMRLDTQQIGALSAMGGTGANDIYLVGGDLLMRTNARLAQDNINAYVRTVKAAGANEEVAKAIKANKSTVLSQPVSSEAMTQALGGEVGVTSGKNYRGVSVASAFAPVKVMDNDWVLLAERETASVFAPLSSFARRIGIAAAIFLPLLMLLSIWAAFSLMRPLRRMTDTANDLADGVDVRFDETQSEWGRLGHEINKYVEMDIWRPAPTERRPVQPQKPLNLTVLDSEPKPRAAKQSDKQKLKNEAAEKKAAEKQAALDKIAKEKAAAEKVRLDKLTEKENAKRAAAEKKAAEKQAVLDAAEEKRNAKRRAAEQKIADKKAERQRIADEKAAAHQAVIDRNNAEQAAKRAAAEKKAADKEAARVQAAEARAAKKDAKKATAKVTSVKSKPVKSKKTTKSAEASIPKQEAKVDELRTDPLKDFELKAAELKAAKFPAKQSPESASVDETRPFPSKTPKKLEPKPAFKPVAVVSELPKVKLASPAAKPKLAPKLAKVKSETKAKAATKSAKPDDVMPLSERPRLRRRRR